MDTTGRNMKRLIKDSAFNHSTTWSPDGQKIIYISSSASTYIKNPSWLLSENYIVWVVDEDIGLASIDITQNSLAVIDINGSNKKILLSNKNHIRTPCWTKNDEQVLVTMDIENNADIYSINIINKDIFRLISTDKQELSPDSYPVYYK
jgi:Tol biopolymer transport system component